MIYASESWLTTNSTFLIVLCSEYISHILHSPYHFCLFFLDEKKNHSQSIRKMQIHYQLSILSEIILYGKGDLLWLFRFISRKVPSDLS